MANESSGLVLKWSPDFWNVIFRPTSFQGSWVSCCCNRSISPLRQLASIGLESQTSEKSLQSSFFYLFSTWHRCSHHWYQNRSVASPVDWIDSSWHVRPPLLSCLPQLPDSSTHASSSWSPSWLKSAFHHLWPPSILDSSVRTSVN